MGAVDGGKRDRSTVEFLHQHPAAGPAVIAESRTHQTAMPRPEFFRRRRDSPSRKEAHGWKIGWREGTARHGAAPGQATVPHASCALAWAGLMTGLDRHACGLIYPPSRKPHTVFS